MIPIITAITPVTRQAEPRKRLRPPNQVTSDRRRNFLPLKALTGQSTLGQGAITCGLQNKCTHGFPAEATFHPLTTLISCTNSHHSTQLTMLLLQPRSQVLSMFPPLAIFCSHAGRAWEQGHYFTSLMQLASWTTHTCTRGLISCLQHQKVSKASRSHKQYLHSQTPRHGPIKSLKTLSIPLKDTVCQSDRVVSCWKLSTQHTIHPQSAIELAEPRKGRHTEPHNETLILQPR